MIGVSFFIIPVKSECKKNGVNPGYEDVSVSTIPVYVVNGKSNLVIG
jgi:hypothetical protein